MPRDFVNEDLGVAAAGGPFAKLFTPAPATDDVLSNLIAARAVIADAARWCAFDRKQMGPDGRYQHCAIGALEEAMARDYGTVGVGDPEVRALATFSKVPSSNGAARAVANHNNQLGHAATLEMFDRAIAARKAELAS